MVGGGVSMLTQETENVKKLVSVLKIPLMIGAGISTGQDIKSFSTWGKRSHTCLSIYISR